MTIVIYSNLFFNLETKIYKKSKTRFPELFFLLTRESREVTHYIKRGRSISFLCEIGYHFIKFWYFVSPRSFLVQII